MERRVCDRVKSLYHSTTNRHRRSRLRLTGRLAPGRRDSDGDVCAASTQNFLYQKYVQWHPFRKFFNKSVNITFKFLLNAVSLYEFLGLKFQEGRDQYFFKI